jgi:hypothetical protein
MDKTFWEYKHRHSSELWDITSEVLTELSRRDEVAYRVKATPESLKKKIEAL